MESAKRSRKPANVHGGSGEIARGSWCTPEDLADALGWFDLDPCSNPRSHILASSELSLENGDDGLLDGDKPGTYRQGIIIDRASKLDRVFVNPPYANGQVIRWIRHYAHTRFCFLLRFDPSTDWFIELYRQTALVCVPRGKRTNFEPPPGVRGSSNTIPHALFYAHAEDATPAILRKCIAWRPHG